MSPNPAYTQRISEPAISETEIQACVMRLVEAELTQGGGNSVALFEAGLARFLKVDPSTVVACSSGTSALHLALLALGVRPGSRVIVPSLTYVATAAALRYVGAEPVFVDVDDSWTIDPTQLARVFERVRKSTVSGAVGIIPVHLYGVPANIAAIRSTAAEFGAWVLEDAAQAMGATTPKGPVGTLTDAATFSFYANKLITTGGEGGAVVLRDLDAAERARLYRGQGQDPNRRYWHSVVGYNYRMTAMQAAFGSAQLARIDHFLRLRHEIGRVYEELLRGYSMPRCPAGCTPVNWLYTVLVPRGINRDSVMANLASNHGIETRPAFPLVSEMPPYVQCPSFPLPVSSDVAARGISLPTHCKMSTGDAERVARALIASVERVNKKGA